MLDLFEVRAGRILEPSAGAGDLVKILEKTRPLSIDAVELDESIDSVCETQLHFSNFFDYIAEKDNTYAGIIGNPPYVAWKDVESGTKVLAAETKKKYSDKCNLYYLFIDRCIDLLSPDGELVFIVPKEWLYTSSAEPLRKKIKETGRLTHIVDCGEDKLFADADVPAIIIFRYVKTPLKNELYNIRFAPTTKAALENQYSEHIFSESNNRFIILPQAYREILQDWGRLGDHFEVKVGMVSGADSIFRKPEMIEIDESCIKKYLTTKGVENFIDVNEYSIFSAIPKRTREYLMQHKTDLINRKINSFNETNWWKYGAVRNKKIMLSDRERFYCFVKTRKKDVFFSEPSAKLYSGGILGLFKEPESEISVDEAILLLNSKKYRKIFESMFLTTGNKLSLQPPTLSNMFFPKTKEALHEWLKGS
jgi:adenine-specific DNA-methyltransferase